MPELLQFHFNPFSVIFLVSTILSLGLMVFLIRRRYSSLTITVFLTVLFTTGAASLIQSLAINAATPEGFRFWNLALYLPIILLPPLHLSFVRAYLGSDSSLKKYWYTVVVSLPVCVILFFIWTSNLIISTDIHHLIQTPWGFVPITDDRGITLLQIYQLTYYIIAMILLVNFYLSVSRPQEKMRSLLMTIAVFIPAAGSIFFSGILPALTHFPIFPASSLMGNVATFIIFYAIIKYGISFFNPGNLASVVFDGMSETVIGINPLLAIEFVNRGSELLLQYTKQQLLNKPLSFLFPDQNQYNQINTQLIEPLKSQNRTRIEKIDILSAQGKKIQVSISATKLLGEDGQLGGYILILTDVSLINDSLSSLQDKVKEIEQKNIDLEKLREDLLKEKESIEGKIQERTRDLHAEHARLQASINNLSLGFIMTDNEKSIIMLNKAIKDIFYLVYPEANISLLDIQAHLQNVDIIAELSKALRERTRVVLSDVRMESKFVNIFISPIVIEEKGVAETIGAVIVVEDETAIKLIQQSKEEFFAIASHELRTPLTAIKGYISLIKQMYFDTIHDDQLKQMLLDIDTSSARLITLVNDFLDSTKLEQGKIQVKQEPCDLIILIDEAIKETQSIAMEKKLYLKSEHQIPTLMVLGDKERLKQVVINLISNAMKFTTQGGITVQVMRMENNFAKALVIDTGRGISEQSKTLLFHKFQQAHDGSSLREPGTGLGLYISKLLVEKMGGRIQLEASTVNQGSTFSFTVPTVGE